MKQNPLPLADRLLADPDYAIRVFRELKQERVKRAHLEKQSAEHRRWAALIRPKLDFFDRVLRRDELLPTAVIAADYSMSERDFTDMLRALGICTDTGYGLRLMQLKRVTAKEKPVENEKFAFRVFLIRLGFVGQDFRVARKILLKNLTGNSAFKNGVPSRQEVAADE